MSLATMMKNVYTFAQILGQASGTTAGLWDELALQNALKWAAYCQRIHQHVKNKAVERSLDKMLLDMMVMIEPASTVCLSVDLLGQAIQLLQKTLLENPLTSQVVVSQLAAQRKRDETEVMKHFSEMISMDSVSDLPEEVISCLEDKELSESQKQTKGQSQTPTQESPVIRAQAGVIIQHLKNLHKLHSPETLLSHVEHTLERTTCLKRGWEILVCMVYVPVVSPDNCESWSGLRSMVVKWMSGKRDHNLKLWAVPCLMLDKAATEDAEFCRLYLTVLTWLASQMKADYHPLTDGKLDSWRCQCEDTVVVLQDLVNRCQSLLDCGGSTRRMTVSVIMDEAQDSYFNVWRDVCRKLH